jgi:hypothetical protein
MLRSPREMPPPFRALRASIPSVALLLLLTVPFAGRAHHIDDPLYVAAARQAWSAPLDPLGGPSFWHDRPTTLFHDLYNPPLTAYFLALPVALGGGSEWPVHMTMILLAAATLVAAAWAGEALGVAPRWCLLLAASPALCVASVSAMADVPFLLLTVLAWGAAARGRASWSGVLAGLSALTKYAGLLNVPLSLVPLARSGRRKPLVSLAIAGGIFLAWCVWTRAAYGQPHVAAAARFQAFGLHRQGEFLLSLVAALGLAGLPAALGLIRWTRGTAAVSLVAGALGAGLVHARGGAPVNVALAWAAFGAGVALLGAAWRASASEARRDPFLPACFWGYAAYSVLLVYFGAARYVLPLLPPLVWLLARSGVERGNGRWVVSVAGGAALSLLVLWGDSGYANAWRTAAARLPREGRRLETGHWGFQWYAAGQGYAPLSPRDVLDHGDVVAQAEGIHRAGPWPAQSALLGGLTAVTVPSPWLRVMDARAQAGLYSSAWGLLPFGLRSPAAEVVRVSTPAAWVLRASASPPAPPVSVDLGTAEARGVLLDGWSGDEAFVDAGGRTTFVWSVGPEAALRVPLPRGVERVRLRASPTGSAVGPLRLSLGPTASAIVDLAPGWRTYDALVDGPIAGGPTTVVLRPAGYRRPGPLGGEDRPLSVAVDAIVFGAGDPGEPGESRGVWPVATEAGPGLFVAASVVTLLDGAVARVRGRVRVASGSADLTWSGAAAPAWSGVGETCAAGCAFDLAPPAVTARLVFRADRAIVTEVQADPAPP